MRTSTCRQRAGSTSNGTCAGCRKGGKVVLVPLPPAVARAVDRAIGERGSGPILRNTTGARMDRRAATRRLKHLAASAGIRMPRMHPHMLRHTFVSTMRHTFVSTMRHTFVTTVLDAGVSLRGVQIAARHADPKTTMRRPGTQEPRPAPPLPPRRLHGLQYMQSKRLSRVECFAEKSVASARRHGPGCSDDKQRLLGRRDG
ncbi:tyrosine-type recombinase/integrase [Couchioplanes caeruleus subsp. azureus]|uniref:tyrosine-type recombinase/integrase n=1 Tax=Couchioplanes caeruleus TaxID=56438 RepID=UPI00227D8821